MESEEHNTVIERDNAESVTDSIIQLRLNTSAVMNEIKYLMTGEKEEYIQQADGQVLIKKVVTGFPKANRLGVDAIVMFTAGKINSSVVQGNLTAEKLEYVMYDIHVSLTDIIMENAVRYGIHDGDINLIIDTIIQMTELFLSRVVGNKERESYSQLRYVENNTAQIQKSGLFSRNK